MKTVRRLVMLLGITAMLSACGEAGGIVTGTVIGCELTDCLDSDDRRDGLRHR